MSRFRTRAKFVITLTLDRCAPEQAWWRARVCEQLLRDHAPAGVVVEGVELGHVPGGPSVREIVLGARRSASAHPTPRQASPTVKPRRRPLVGDKWYVGWLDKVANDGHLTAAEYLQAVSLHSLVRWEWLQRRDRAAR